MTDPRRPLAVVFGVADAVAAIVVLVGVFAGLPARFFIVDGCALLVAVLFGASSVGLLSRRPWAETAARIAAGVALALALVLLSLVAVTVSYLLGVYGQVGRGGVIIFVLGLALALPYLLLLPIAQLVWVGPPRKRAT